MVGAFIDGATEYLRKGTQGALGAAVKDGRIPPVDKDGNISLTGVACQFMGDKYGGMAGTALQLWAKFRPESFENSMNKLMGQGSE